MNITYRPRLIISAIFLIIFSCTKERVIDSCVPVKNFVVNFYGVTNERPVFDIVIDQPFVYGNYALKVEVSRFDPVKNEYCLHSTFSTPFLQSYNSSEELRYNLVEQGRFIEGNKVRLDITFFCGGRIYSHTFFKDLK